MKNLILFDDNSWAELLPLTYTRPVAEIRTGILTIREKWEKMTGTMCSWFTQDYLQEKFRLITGSDNILINGSVIPDEHLVAEVMKLVNGEALVREDCLIAAAMDESMVEDFRNKDNCEFKNITYPIPFLKLNNLWEIFCLNGELIKADFKMIIHGRVSQPVSKTVNVINPGNIFIEEGARLEFVTLNAENGPVYIGKNAEIMEGSLIRGPFALCENAVVKMGAKIYGPTTIGPYSKAGGEINNCVLFSYSNKAHDGFLGNSVIGEWCNLGADSNNSNLKNNYAEVKLWSHSKERFMSTGLQFCGLIMGDHSKCGINTMLNTGTVVGVFVNLFGSGFPRNFIPSFSWGGPNSGYTTYNKTAAFYVAKTVMERRDLIFDETEKKILNAVFDMTISHRNMEPANPL
ncbi:MAG: GlmU family protein [Bacteroidia bacterium]|nr:GlmU family protein [Bacteroidia bacterium]